VTNELTGTRAIHLCVDMQSMFAESTEWHAPWLKGVLPAVEAIVARHPERTIFTRFIPPQNPESATGAWRGYYEHWRSMTRERLAPDLIDLVPSLARFAPPARVLDKPIYSPWLTGELHPMLVRAGIDTLIITGGETDVCVLAAVMGAIDLGYRVVVPTDAVFGSADQTHDAVLTVYQSRFGTQLFTCSTEQLIDDWKVTSE
jgi:nicotinamidase-related amidase